MKRLAVLAAIAIAFALGGGIAHAETPPTRWETAKDPAVKDRWLLHVKVRELLSLSRANTPKPVIDAARLRARAMLEEGHAAESPDVRLRYDLGEVYYELDQFERAIGLLKPAIEANPDHPSTIDGLVVLAYAYAKLDRSKEEVLAYRRFLAKTTSDFARATAVLNLAEAEMHLGNLEEAVGGYRDAMRISETLPQSLSAHHTRTLAIWGLAVALDRSGDRVEALKVTERATENDPEEILLRHGEEVFFVPEYEKDWYLALAETVHARAATDPRIAVRRWKLAEAHWDAYVQPAERNNDRWLAIAKAQRDRTKAARIEAEARAARTPVPPAPKPPKPEIP